MIRYFFIFLLLVHGLIHVMGYMKAFKPDSIAQLTLPISKPVGILWLLTTLLFGATLLLFAFQKGSWWMVALPAVLLSQVLIVMVWRDAKFGTLANGIALVAIILAMASWRFDQMVQNDLKTLFSTEIPEKQIVTEDMIAPLPPVVQRWLRRTGVLGREMIHTVHLKQTGAMRTDPAGDKWFPFTAEQYFTSDPPGFVWIADVRMAPWLQTRGRDLYVDGRGHMLIKVLSLIPVADVQGPAIDQGSMLRYLGEIAWFPTAAFSDYLQWEQVDSLTARATMTYGEVTASINYYFNEAGDMLRLDAMRYYDRKEGATLEPWAIEADPETIKEFEGIRFATQYRVIWKLKEGDFEWLQLELTDLEYNRKR